ncbi:MAG: pantoate--beta-alanine ligase [bacterium]|nr:pantoate--beta-alanine ligase [bacterium]
MIFFQKSADIHRYILQKRAEGSQIGFVPTMGALHAGHISLINQAKEKCDLVVCSIFVNPTQFNHASDLASYPRTIEKDMQLLLESNCDILFHPGVEDIYGNDLEKESSSDYGEFIHVLEGESRPGHFDGVVTILRKLFSIIEPNQVFFGQKDYQQCLVVDTLIRRSFPQVVFNLCLIAREQDGLAMSSRNVRLSLKERNMANQIFQSLSLIQTNWDAQNWLHGIEQAKELLLKGNFIIEYISVCNPVTLKELVRFEPKAVALVAVTLGKTRLIDNILLYWREEL